MRVSLHDARRRGIKTIAGQQNVKTNLATNHDITSLVRLG